MPLSLTGHSPATPEQSQRSAASEPLAPSAQSHATHQGSTGGSQRPQARVLLNNSRGGGGPGTRKSKSLCTKNSQINISFCKISFFPTTTTTTTTTRVRRGGGGVSECLFFSTFCERRLGSFSALDKLLPPSCDLHVLICC